MTSRDTHVFAHARLRWQNAISQLSPATELSCQLRFPTGTWVLSSPGCVVNLFADQDLGSEAAFFSCGVPQLYGQIHIPPVFLFCTPSTPSSPPADTEGTLKRRQRDGWGQGHEAVDILGLSTGMDGFRCRNQVCACCIAPSHGHIDAKDAYFSLLLITGPGPFPLPQLHHHGNISLSLFHTHFALQATEDDRLSRSENTLA